MASNKTSKWGFLKVFARTGDKYTKVDLTSQNDLTIGSDKNAVIKLCLDNVDPIHCVLKLQSNGLVLLVNKSKKNPVPINNKAVANEMFLLPNDTFSVMGKRFLLENSQLPSETISLGRKKNMEYMNKIKRKTGVTRNLLTPQPERPKILRQRRSASLGNRETTPEKTTNKSLEGVSCSDDSWLTSSPRSPYPTKPSNLRYFNGFTVSSPKSAVRPVQRTSLRSIAMFKNLHETNPPEIDSDSSCSNNDLDRETDMKTPVADVLACDEDNSDIEATPTNNTSIVSIESPIMEDKTPLRSRRSQEKDISIQRLTKNLSIIVVDSPDSKTPKSTLKLTGTETSLANIAKTKLFEESDCESTQGTPVKKQTGSVIEICDSSFDLTVTDDDDVEESLATEGSESTESEFKPSRKSTKIDFVVEPNRDSDGKPSSQGNVDFVEDVVSPVNVDKNNQVDSCSKDFHAPLLGSTPASKKSVKKLEPSFKDEDDIMEELNEDEESEDVDVSHATQDTEESNSMLETTTTSDSTIETGCKRKRGLHSIGGDVKQQDKKAKVNTTETIGEMNSFSSQDFSIENEMESSIIEDNDDVKDVDESLLKSPPSNLHPMRKAMTEPRQSKKSVTRRSLCVRISNQENEPVLESNNTTCETVDTSSFVYVKNNVTFESADFGSPIQEELNIKKTQKEPLNDLTDLAGVKQLLQTPRVTKEPLNDLTSVTGVARIMKTPKIHKDHKNTDSDEGCMSGIKHLMKTPQRVPKTVGNEREESDEHNSSMFNMSGVSALDDDDIFPVKKVTRTYGKSLPGNSKGFERGVLRKTEGYVVEVSPEVEKWVRKSSESLLLNKTTDLDSSVDNEKSSKKSMRLTIDSNKIEYDSNSDFELINRKSQNESEESTDVVLDKVPVVKIRGRSMPATCDKKLTNKRTRQTEGTLLAGDVDSETWSKHDDDSDTDLFLRASDANNVEENDSVQESVVSSTVRKSSKNTEFGEDLRDDSVLSEDDETTEGDVSLVEVDIEPLRAGTRLSKRGKSVTQLEIGESFTNAIDSMLDGSDAEFSSEEPIKSPRKSSKKSLAPVESSDEEIVEDNDENRKEYFEEEQAFSTEENLDKIVAEDRKEKNEDVEKLPEPVLSLRKSVRKSLPPQKALATPRKSIRKSFTNAIDSKLDDSDSEFSSMEPINSPRKSSKKSLAQVGSPDGETVENVLEEDLEEDFEEEEAISTEENLDKIVAEDQEEEIENVEELPEPVLSLRKSVRKSLPSQKVLATERKSIRKSFTKAIDLKLDGSDAVFSSGKPTNSPRKSSKKSLAQVGSPDEETVENVLEEDVEEDFEEEDAITTEENLGKLVAEDQEKEIEDVEELPEPVLSLRKSVRKSLPSEKALATPRKSIRKSFTKAIDSKIDGSDVEFSTVEPINLPRKSSKKSLVQVESSDEKTSENVQEEDVEEDFEEEEAISTKENLDKIVPEDQEEEIEDVEELLEPVLSLRKSVRKSLPSQKALATPRKSFRKSFTKAIDSKIDGSDVEFSTAEPINLPRKSSKKSLVQDESPDEKTAENVPEEDVKEDFEEEEEISTEENFYEDQEEEIKDVEESPEPVLSLRKSVRKSLPSEKALATPRKSIRKTHTNTDNLDAEVSSEGPVKSSRQSFRKSVVKIDTYDEGTVVDVPELNVEEKAENIEASDVSNDKVVATSRKSVRKSLPAEKSVPTPRKSIRKTLATTDNFDIAVSPKESVKFSRGSLGKSFAKVDTPDEENIEEVTVSPKKSLNKTFSNDPDDRSTDTSRKSVRKSLPVEKSVSTPRKSSRKSIMADTTEKVEEIHEDIVEQDEEVPVAVSRKSAKKSLSSESTPRKSVRKSLPKTIEANLDSSVVDSSSEHYVLHASLNKSATENLPEETSKTPVLSRNSVRKSTVTDTETDSPFVDSASKSRRSSKSRNSTVLNVTADPFDDSPVIQSSSTDGRRSVSRSTNNVSESVTPKMLMAQDDIVSSSSLRRGEVTPKSVKKTGQNSGTFVTPASSSTPSQSKDENVFKTPKLVPKMAEPESNIEVGQAPAVKVNSTKQVRSSRKVVDDEDAQITNVNSDPTVLLETLDVANHEKSPQRKTRSKRPSASTSETRKTVKRVKKTIEEFVEPEPTSVRSSTRKDRSRTISETNVELDIAISEETPTQSTRSRTRGKGKTDAIETPSTPIAEVRSASRKGRGKVIENKDVEEIIKPVKEVKTRSRRGHTKAAVEIDAEAEPTQSRRGKEIIEEESAKEVKITSPSSRTSTGEEPVKEVKATRSRKAKVTKEKPAIEGESEEDESESKPAKELKPTTRSRRGQKVFEDEAPTTRASRAKTTKGNKKEEDSEVKEAADAPVKPTSIRNKRGQKVTKQTESIKEIQESKSKETPVKTTRSKRGQKVIKETESVKEIQVTKDKSESEDESEVKEDEAPVKTTRSKRGQNVIKQTEPIKEIQETKDQSNSEDEPKLKEVEEAPVKTTRRKRGEKVIKETESIKEIQVTKDKSESEDESEEVDEAPVKTSRNKRGQKITKPTASIQDIQVIEDKTESEDESAKPTSKPRKGKAPPKVTKTTRARGKKVPVVDEPQVDDEYKADEKEDVLPEEKPTRAKRTRKATLKSEVVVEPPAPIKRGRGKKLEAIVTEVEEVVTQKTTRKGGTATTVTLNKKVTFDVEAKRSSRTIQLTPEPRVAKRRLKSEDDLNDFSPTLPNAKKTRSGK